MISKIIRTAFYAGSWYESDPNLLDQNLTNYLSNAQYMLPEGGKLKVLIGPHAGVTQSHQTSAWAYKNMAPHVDEFDRVVLLGPSHRYYLEDIGITKCDEYQTPLGNI